MTARSILAGVVTMLMTAWPPDSAEERQGAGPRERSIQIGNASIYTREIGNGRPVIVLHGGPDFDTGYLLPDLDRLADTVRLIYYDQRGRGQSAAGVRPEDVTLASDVADLDAVRAQFQLPSAALLGHSWGAVLALEYAVRHPTRVSHLILMNPAPVSTSDAALLRAAYTKQLGVDLDRQRAIQAGAAYKAGDPETVAARYRIHFKFALKRQADYEKLLASLKAGFVRQGSEGILKAWAVEDRLMRDTWATPTYDLLPRLGSLNIPTLVIYGDGDFIPVAISEHIARTIPKARMVTLRNCGHFTYLECPDDVRNALNEFLGREPR
jgi:proline iminopeptidase